MTMGKARTAAPRWPGRAGGKGSHLRQVTFATLLADVLYRVAIRARVRRAVGVESYPRASAPRGACAWLSGGLTVGVTVG
jgi:hypothetical protein